MANTTFYERGNAYHDSAGNPAIIKNGNELTFTEHFNVGGGGGGTPYTPPAYSTDEVDTGRKWINNKNVYEKVISFDSPVNISTSSIGSIGVSSTGIETILKAVAINNDGTTSPLTLACRYLGETNLNAKALGYGSSFSAKYIIFEYTKTTPTRTSKKKG